MPTRFVHRFALLALCGLAAPPAVLAQRLIVPQEAPGNLGGGFIELLMTGREPAPRQGAPIPDVRILSPRPLPPAPRSAHAGSLLYSAPEAELDEAPQPLISPRGRGPRREAAPAPIEPGFDSKFERQEVPYSGPHAAGTLVIDTPNRFLYFVQGNGRALRYGIGVGRPGFEWAGVKSVTRKAEWPDWRPPAEMLKRRPDLPRFMAGGPENPLGARALYLGSSLYRIHGTNEPATIGRAVSSGCIRMRNSDVVDLYERVKVGSKVVVI